MTSKKALLCLVTLLLLAPAAFGADKLKIYGEISNYASFRTRDFVRDESGTFDLVPVDRDLNSVGLDLNDKRSMDFLCLSSRAGLLYNDSLNKGAFRMRAGLEADFLYKPESYTTIRLRHAYFASGWNFKKGRILAVLAGQTWHPFAENAPMGFSLSRHAPFNPYSLAPQIRVGYSFNKYIRISVAALWQSYGRSLGPEGASTAYIRYAVSPELYVGLRAKYRGFESKAGFSYLSIKPRTTAQYLYGEVTLPVNDRIGSVAGFVYMGYSAKNWEIRAKVTHAQSGERLMMMSGYAASGYKNPGGYTYTPYRNTASWLSGAYKCSFGKSGIKLRSAVMAGYTRNHGTKDKVLDPDEEIYFTAGAQNFIDAWRISPDIELQYRNFSAGLSYEFTAARYGDADTISSTDGRAVGPFHTEKVHSVNLKLGFMF